MSDLAGMSRIKFWSIVSLALGFFLFLHVVVFFYLHRFLSTVTLSTFLGAMFLLSFGSLFILRRGSNVLFRLLHFLGYVWMGVVLISAIAAVILMVAELVLQQLIALKWFLILLAFLLVLGLYNAFIPKVRKLTITVPKTFGKLHIVQLSDLHLGEVYGKAALERVVRMVEELKPDVVAITGDLFDGTSVEEEMIVSLRRLKMPVLFVSGNHEEYAGLSRALHIVHDAGIKVLDGRALLVKGVYFAGVGYSKRMIFAQPPKDVPAVLLKHAPALPTAVIDAGFDVQLSGHTHHGQIWPLSYFVLFAFPHRSGAYRKKDFIMYTSQGVGTWGPPFRLGSRAEITSITLQGR